MAYTPLERAVFHPQPFAAKGDDSPDPIWLAVGEALTNWEKVEHRLASLYGLLLGVRQPVGAIRAYGAIATFTARRSMLMAASSALFHWKPNDDLRLRINRLVSNVCAEASSRRNEIAHGIVIYTASSPNDRTGYFLCPGYYSSLKRDNNDEAKYEMTARQIKYFSDGYAALTRDIFRISDEVMDWQVAPHPPETP